jgi:prepilin-type N-terminal cleavage/methylation domain-containing protein
MQTIRHIKISIQKVISGKKRRAFTLVEILVVIGLFSTISTLSLGALFNAQAINTRLQETQSILDNINLSVLSVSREVRFGTEFSCVDTSIYMPNITDYLRYPNIILDHVAVPHNCAYTDNKSGNLLAFKKSDAENSSDRTIFYVENGVLYKKDFPFGLQPTVYQMTSSDVEIRTLTFYVEGAESSIAPIPDYKQPLVTMLLSGVTKPTSITNTPVEFNLEIIMSSRQPDNK